MKQVTTTLPEMMLIGVSVRTNNRREMTVDGQIGPFIHAYFAQQLAEKIPHRVVPGATYCVYTNYENGTEGDYTYFIGERVKFLKDIPPGFFGLTIPAQAYSKLTNDPGTMPQVCIEMWQKIWQMSPSQLGGERAFVADFELYDERAINSQNAVLDIFIGLCT